MAHVAIVVSGLNVRPTETITNAVTIVTTYGVSQDCFTRATPSGGGCRADNSGDPDAVRASHRSLSSVGGGRQAGRGGVTESRTFSPNMYPISSVYFASISFLSPAVYVFFGCSADSGTLASTDVAIRRLDCRTAGRATRVRALLSMLAIV